MGASVGTCSGKGGYDILVVEEEEFHIEIQPGDMLFGKLRTQDSRAQHPFRARFDDTSKGTFSFIYDGTYSEGMLEIKGNVILLYDAGMSKGLPKGRLVVKSMQQGTAPVEVVEGHLASAMSQRDAFRPRPSPGKETLLFIGGLERRGLDLQPGGRLARELLLENVVAWFGVTAAGFAAFPISSSKDGTPALAYLGYTPFLLWHLWKERQMFLRYFGTELTLSAMKDFFFSALDHYDLLTDVLFIVAAMKSSSETTPGRAAQWGAVPLVGDYLGSLSSNVGFGYYVLGTYLLTVFFPQGLLGIYHAWTLQKNTLERDPAGQRLEEDILSLQDAAASASFTTVEKGLKAYVEKLIDKFAILTGGGSGKHLLNSHDETLSSRMLKRVFLENLLQLWNQTTFLGLRYGASSDWATAQTLSSVFISLGVAFMKARDLGASTSNLFLWPITLGRWALIEIVNVQFQNPHEQEDQASLVVRELQSGWLQVASANEPLSRDEASNVATTYNFETFRTELIRRRQVMMGTIIMITIALVLVRSAGVQVCQGPFNLMSGCINEVSDSQKPILDASVRLLQGLALLMATGVLAAITCGHGEPSRHITRLACFPRALRGKNLIRWSQEQAGSKPKSLEIKNIVCGDLPCERSATFCLVVAHGGRDPAAISSSIEGADPKVVHVQDIVTLRLTPSEEVRFTIREFEAGQTRDLCDLTISAKTLLEARDRPDRSYRFCMEKIGAARSEDGQPWIFFSLDASTETRDVESMSGSACVRIADFEQGISEDHSVENFSKQYPLIKHQEDGKLMPVEETTKARDPAYAALGLAENIRSFLWDCLALVSSVAFPVLAVYCLYRLYCLDWRLLCLCAAGFLSLSILACLYTLRRHASEAQMQAEWKEALRAVLTQAEQQTREVSRA